MAHALPPPPVHHRGWRLLGILCVVLGVMAAGVAVYALRQPGGRQAARSFVSANSRSMSAGTADLAPSSTSRPGTTASGGSGWSSGAPNPRTDSATSQPVIVALVIANNTAAASLAGVAAARFEAKGWPVTAMIHFSGDILSTCAYYDPRQPNAERAAAALQKQFPGIKRVKERFDGLPEAPIVVVLTDDWR